MSTLLWFSVRTAVLNLMAQSWMDNRKESPSLEVWKCKVVCSGREGGNEGR